MITGLNKLFVRKLLENRSHCIQYRPVYPPREPIKRDVSKLISRREKSSLRIGRLRKHVVGGGRWVMVGGWSCKDSAIRGSGITAN